MFGIAHPFPQKLRTRTEQPKHSQEKMWHLGNGINGIFLFLCLAMEIYPRHMSTLPQFFILCLWNSDLWKGKWKVLCLTIEQMDCRGRFLRVHDSPVSMSYLAFVEFLKICKVWIIETIKAISYKNEHFLWLQSARFGVGVVTRWFAIPWSIHSVSLSWFCSNLVNPVFCSLTRGHRRAISVDNNRHEQTELI